MGTTEKKGRKLLTAVIVLAFAATAFSLVAAADDSDAAATELDNSNFAAEIVKGGDYKLKGNITMSDSVTFDKDCTIDLNGFSVTVSETKQFVINDSKTVTFKNTAKTDSSITRNNGNNNEELFAVSGTICINNLTVFTFSAAEPDSTCINLSGDGKAVIVNGSKVDSEAGGTAIGTDSTTTTSATLDDSEINGRISSIKNITLKTKVNGDYSSLASSSITLDNITTPADLDCLPANFTVSGGNILTGTADSDITIAGTGTVVLNDINVEAGKTLKYVGTVTLTGMCSIMGTIDATSIAIGTSDARGTVTFATAPGSNIVKTNGDFTVGQTHALTVNAGAQFKTVRIGNVTLTGNNGVFTTGVRFADGEYTVSCTFTDGLHGTAKVKLNGTDCESSKINLTATAPESCTVTLEYVADASKDVKSIEVQGEYRTEYIVGERFDPAGLKIKVTFENDSTEIRTPAFTDQFGTFTTAGTVTLKITYEGHDADITVTVKNTPYFYKVTVTAGPQYVSVTVGDVKLTGNDGVFTCTEYLKAGTYTVGFELRDGLFGTTSMKVGGQTAADMKVTMKDGTPEYSSDGKVSKPVEYTISLTYTADAEKDITDMTVTDGYKTEYILYERFDPADMKVNVTFADGQTKDVAANCIFSPERFDRTGDVEVTIEYMGVSKTVTVKVVAGANPDIEMELDDGKVSPAQKTEILNRIAENKAAGKTPVVSLEAPSFFSVGFDTDIIKSMVDAKGTLALTTVKGTAVFTYDDFSELTIANGKDAVFTLKTLKDSEVPANQKEFVGTDDVFSISLDVGGAAVTGFGGDVKVMLKYTPTEDQDTDHLRVVFLAADGDTDKLDSEYVTENNRGYMVFETEHFSLYTVKEYEPSSGTSVWTYVGIALGILAVVFIAFVLLKKKGIL